jgi:hypothetical protein
MSVESCIDRSSNISLSRNSRHSKEHPFIQVPTKRPTKAATRNFSPPMCVFPEQRLDHSNFVTINNILASSRKRKNVTKAWQSKSTKKEMESDLNDQPRSKSPKNCMNASPTNSSSNFMDSNSSKIQEKEEEYHLNFDCVSEDEKEDFLVKEKGEKKKKKKKSKKKLKKKKSKKKKTSESRISNSTIASSPLLYERPKSRHGTGRPSLAGTSTRVSTKTRIQIDSNDAETKISNSTIVSSTLQNERPKSRHGRPKSGNAGTPTRTRVTTDDDDNASLNFDSETWFMNSETKISNLSAESDNEMDDFEETNFLKEQRLQVKTPAIVSTPIRYDRPKSRHGRPKSGGHTRTSTRNRVTITVDDDNVSQDFDSETWIIDSETKISISTIPSSRYDRPKSRHGRSKTSHTVTKGTGDDDDDHLLTHSLDLNSETWFNDQETKISNSTIVSSRYDRPKSRHGRPKSGTPTRTRMVATDSDDDLCISLDDFDSSQVDSLVQPKNEYSTMLFKKIHTIPASNWDWAV